MAGLSRAGRGRPRLGRRRPGVRRLPQRLRRDVRRPREPAGRRRRQGAPRSGNPLRGADRGLDRRRRGARRPLRATAVAVHELGHRVDDGRCASGSRGDRPRRDAQDRGLLPRPPRRGDGLGLSGARGARRSRRPALRRLRRGLSEGAHRAHARGPVQRRRRARERALQARLPSRRDDHGAGDDEHQHHPAGRGLPRARARALHRPRREADLRRGEDRRHDRARRRHQALRPTVACTSTGRSTATRW